MPEPTEAEQAAHERSELEAEQRHYESESYWCDGSSNFAAGMREAYEFWGDNETEQPTKGRYISTAR